MTELSDLEMIRRYAQFSPAAKARRKQLLGTASAKTFSLPTTVVSEMQRQATREGTTLSNFVFTALVREILARRTWEKHRDRAGRVAAEKIPDDAKAGGSTKRAKGA